MSELEVIRPRHETWWSRALRSITLGPYNTKDKALARIFGSHPVSSGVSVSEETAINYAPVWAAVNLISSHIASVPLHLYRRTEDGRGKEILRSHPLYRVIHAHPNPHMGSMMLRKTLQAHALVWGNGYAEIERVGGRPVALWPLMPYDVEPFFTETGALRYRVHNYTRQPTIFAPEDILHIRGWSPNGVHGYSVIQRARENLGLGIAAERFGGSFFGNGAQFGGLILQPAGVQPDQRSRDEFQQSIREQHQGVDKAHRFLVLYGGAKYERLGIPPDDAQFLQTREWQAQDVCRWFNIPQHKVQILQNTSYNSIEQLGIEYVTDTLNPWWKAWEEELCGKLIFPQEQNIQLIEHVREGMLQGDSTSRSELQSKQFSVGALTPNEIRAMENRNPIEGGDRAFIYANAVPLDRLDEHIAVDLELKKAQVEKLRAEAQTALVPPKPDTDDRVADLEEQVRLARHAAQLAEDLRDVARADLERAQAALTEVSEARTAAEGRLVEVLAERDVFASARAAQETRAQQALADLQATAQRLVSVETSYAEAVARAAEADAALTQAQAEREAERQTQEQERRIWLGDLHGTAVAWREQESALHAALEVSAKVKTWLDAEQAAHASTRAELEQAKAESLTLRDTHEKSIGELQASLETALAEGEQARADVAEVSGRLDAEQAAHARTEQLRQEAEQARASAVETGESLMAACAQAEAAEQQARADLEAVRADLAAMTETAQEAASRAEAAASERDDARQQLQQAVVDVAAVRAELGVVRDDLAEVRQQLRGAELALETERAQTRQQKAALLASMRSLFVEATERLLQRESNRARNNQATAEKFRTWLESFYPLHEEVVRATFLPLVGPWSAIVGGEASELLARLVEQHLRESTTALRLVLDGEDDDERAARLERTLRRWESERADRMADALVREGMAG